MDWEKLLNLPNGEDGVVPGAERDIQEFVIERLLSIVDILSLCRRVGFAVTATAKGRTAILLSDNQDADQLLANVCLVEFDPWEADRLKEDRLRVVEARRNRAFLAFAAAIAFGSILFLGSFTAIFTHYFGHPDGSAAHRRLLAMAFGMIARGVYPAAFGRRLSEDSWSHSDALR